jgi:conjugal transfer mating pair stabilization protein TraN
MSLKRFLYFVSLTLTLSPNAFGEICAENTRTCIEGPETRNINGVLIYQDCWKYDVNYKCRQGNNYTDNCSSIKSTLGCEQVSSICVNQVSIDDLCDQ